MILFAKNIYMSEEFSLTDFVTNGRMSVEKGATANRQLAPKFRLKSNR
jgi:hypothetical protein